MARKTVDIVDLKCKINDMILHSPDCDASGRSALALLLTSVLHDANQYKGFNYLSPNMMLWSKSGVTIGIDPSKPEGERFIGTDETRVLFL